MTSKSMRATRIKILEQIGFRVRRHEFGPDNDTQ